MKISYLLASNKNPQYIKNVVDNIYDLPDHNFEVIICSKSNYQDGRALCLQDDEGASSVCAFNKAYKYSDGDIIVICVDDHQIPHNIIELPDFFMSDQIQQLKFKAANLTHILGGPGKLYYFKEDQRQMDTVWWDLHSVFSPDVKNLRPYNVFHFPALLRDTIETYMDGVIFNESFIHHYCDSWLGFYEEKINGQRECKDLGPNHIWFKVIKRVNLSQVSNQHDAHDKEMMRKLIELSDQDISYNTKVN
jgi:glycosyltransferase involved in cell wall biosynthesis